jgi:DNA-binding response OmpR family regulator
MRRLRQKVEVDPNRPAHLLTVRGVGYRFVAAPAPAAGDDGGRR